MDKKKEEQTLQWIVSPLIQWYSEQARVLPWRENHDPYRVWISEIMLQQTRVEAVIPYYKQFMENFPNIKALSCAKEERVLKLWEGLGYYSRARNLKKAAEIVCREYQGQFPKEYKDILSLPGIGEYTAGAISSIALGKPRAAVDGNVLRVITRLMEWEDDILDGKLRKKVGGMLEAVYPAGKCSEFTQSLMELGAVVCVPNGAPKCEECPLKSGCKAHCNSTWNKYPVKRQKAKRKKVDKTVLILSFQEYIAVKKREEQGLLAGMWEFPNIDKKMTLTEIRQWVEEKGITVSQIQKTKNAKHIFTHLEWNMYCYHIQCESKNDTFYWISEDDLENNIPLPTVFWKCL